MPTEINAYLNCFYPAPLPVVSTVMDLSRLIAAAYPELRGLAPQYLTPIAVTSFQEWIESYFRETFNLGQTRFDSHRKEWFNATLYGLDRYNPFLTPAGVEIANAIGGNFLEVDGQVYILPYMWYF